MPTQHAINVLNSLSAEGGLSNIQKTPIVINHDPNTIKFGVQWNFFPSDINMENEILSIDDKVSTNITMGTTNTISTIGRFFSTRTFAGYGEEDFSSYLVRNDNAGKKETYEVLKTS
jgi:hypothetical protein